MIAVTIIGIKLDVGRLNNNIVSIEYNLEFIDWNISIYINTNNFPKLHKLLLVYI